MRSAKILTIFSIVVYLAGTASSFIWFYEPCKVSDKNLVKNKLHYERYNFKIIFTNNLLLIFSLIAGSFLFGSLTLANLFYNGFVFGIVISSAFGYNRTYEVLLLTFPHGIFEIPAIIIAGAAGFKIPYEIIRYLAGKKEQPLTKEDIKEYLMFTLISIILIIIAAWIEANITLKIAQAMLNRRSC